MTDRPSAAGAARLDLNLGLFAAVVVCAALFAVPLAERQFASPRPGFILYPLLLAALAYGLAWAIRGIAGRPSGERGTVARALLLVAACLAAGHFVAWFATIGPVMARAWRGNILVLSLGVALISLFGATWAALAMRFSIRPSPFTVALLFLGWAAIVAAWIAAELANWTFTASGSGRHYWFWTVIERSLAGRYRLSAYAITESLYWQLVWPLLGLAALTGMLFAWRPRAPAP
jgi:hypothetical protein